MSKPIPWLSSALILLATILVAWQVWRAESRRITEGNGMRIVKAMSLTEVEGILGPERDETDGNAAVFGVQPQRGGIPVPPDPLEKLWISQEATVIVRFHGDAVRVSEVECRPTILFSDSPSLWERIADWFGIKTKS